MTIEQTIEIPETSSHDPVILQLVQGNEAIMELQIPQYLPVGKAKVAFTVTPQNSGVQKITKPLRSLRGIGKDMDTMDAYFKRKWADKAKEEANNERQRQEAVRYSGDR
jgi:hypothetical protein